MKIFSKIFSKTPPLFFCRFWGTLLFFFFIALYPLFFLFEQVFQTWATLPNPWDWTSRQQELLLRTLLLSIQSLFWTLLLGAPSAWFLAKYTFSGKTILLSLMTLPLFIPPYLHAILWSDWANASVIGASWVLGVSYFPYVFWMTYQALLSLDGQIEKSFLLHFPVKTVFWKCYLPLISPSLLGALLLVFILASANFGVPQVLLVQVYSLEIFTQYSIFLQVANATLVSLPLIFLSFTGLVFLLKTEKTVDLYSQQSSPALIFPRGKSFVWGIWWTVFVIFLSLLLPLVSLLQKISFPFPLQKALETGGKELWTTFLMSFWTATAVTGISWILGQGFAHYKRNRHLFLALHFLCLSSFVFPGILLATGMTRFWVRWDFIYLSIVILIFASIARFAPFGVHIATRLFSRLPQSALHSASLYGGPKLVWRFSRECLAKDFGAIWILTYALTFGELDASILVKNPYYIPIGPTILSLLHFGHPEVIAMLILLSMILGILPVFFYLLWTESSPAIY